MAAALYRCDERRHPAAAIATAIATATAAATMIPDALTGEVNPFAIFDATPAPARRTLTRPVASPYTVSNGDAHGSVRGV
jgi:hypothetical protein